ncbi:MAG: hypothetical protein VB092_00340 [Oscillospiraceae bacterium]|nr:hypothetical protein [Oscillospiraceae bacterium]
MRKQTRAKFRDFFKGFFITLAVLVPLYAGVFAVQLNKRTAAAQESAADPFEKVPVSAARSYNLLFLVRDSVGDRLMTATVLRFDVTDGRVVAADVPNTAVLLESKQPRTISEIFAGKGALGAAAALRDTLGIPLSGYICLDTQGLAALVDALGEFSFSLERPLEVHDSEWLVVYSKEAGISWFSGNDVAKLLLYGNYADADAVRLRKQLDEAALLEYANADFPAKISEAYEQLVNRFDTDVNVAGLYSLTLAAQAACVNGDFTVRSVQGAFADGRFEIDASAPEELQRLFGKAA